MRRSNIQPMPAGGSALAALAVLAALMFLTGCVERTITITSEPPGALVYLNDREVGRTPVDVEFIHYGTYDVRLVKEGYEPLLTFGDADAPLWDLPGPDLLAELVPVEVRSDVEWHYVLEPARNDPEALVERAQQFRHRITPADAPQTDRPDSNPPDSTPAETSPHSDADADPL